MLIQYSHVSPQTLCVYKYHGVNRVTKLDDFLPYNVVLTTSHVLAMEFARGNSTLQKVEKFRVVLNEGEKLGTLSRMLLT